MHERTSKLRRKTSKPEQKAANSPLWEILVPTHDNHKTPFTIEHHQQWDRKVLAISGGLTINKIARGRWAEEGVEFWETMIPVRIGCTKDQIEKIAEMTARHYDQLAVDYLLLSEQHFILKRNASK